MKYKRSDKCIHCDALLCWYCTPVYELADMALEPDEFYGPRVYPTTYFDEFVIKYRGEVMLITPEDARARGFK